MRADLVFWNCCLAFVCLQGKPGAIYCLLLIFAVLKVTFDSNERRLWKKTNIQLEFKEGGP